MKPRLGTPEGSTYPEKVVGLTTEGSNDLLSMWIIAESSPGREMSETRSEGHWQTWHLEGCCVVVMWPSRHLHTPNGWIPSQKPDGPKQTGLWVFDRSPTRLALQLCFTQVPSVRALSVGAAGRRSSAPAQRSRIAESGFHPHMPKGRV